jgi:hypothetical protein
MDFTAEPGAGAKPGLVRNTGDASNWMISAEEPRAGAKDEVRIGRNSKRIVSSRIDKVQACI